MTEKYMHPADEICTIMTRIYDGNMTTVSGGNLSIRDNEGNIWISPSGGDKACLQHDDILKVLPDGTIVGKNKSSLESPIHLGIMKARPDIKAILHAHPPALVSISLLHELPETRITAQLHELAGGMDVAIYGTPGSQELVENVVKVFSTGKNVAILENHGVFIGSTESLHDAYSVFEAMDFGMRTQINAMTLDEKGARVLTDDQLNWYASVKPPVLPVFKPEFHSNEEILQRAEICKLGMRAYLKQLFTREQGVVSARVDANSFVITPHGADNAHLIPEDMVLIRDGKTEDGKIPASSVLLHKAIYDANPGIGGIIMASSPYAMTFAVTDEEYDVRLIPECYNRLRATKKFPFGATVNMQKELAEYISTSTPVAIVENDCFIIASNTVFAAFDRLEIAEYCAKSVHYTKRLKKEIVNITQEQIDALTARFNLK